MGVRRAVDIVLDIAQHETSRIYITVYALALQFTTQGNLSLPAHS